MDAALILHQLLTDIVSINLTGILGARDQYHPLLQKRS